MKNHPEESAPEESEPNEGATRLSLVAQLARAVRVPPQEPNGAVVY